MIKIESKRFLTIALFHLISCILFASHPISVETKQSLQKLHELGEDFLVYETKYVFKNFSSNPISLVQRNFSFLIPSGEVITKGEEPMEMKGIIPAKGQLEWTDFPYISKRWAERALELKSDRLILRQSFRLKDREQTYEIYCDTVYLLDPSKIAMVSLSSQVKIKRGRREPLFIDLRDEVGRPVLPWANLGLKIENPDIAKVEGNLLIGLQIGTTVLKFDNGRIKREAILEVVPSLEDEKTLPPFIRLLVGEKRFLLCENLPPNETLGFVILNKQVAGRGEIATSQGDKWDVRCALEADIKEAEDILEGRKTGKTDIIVRGLRSGLKREGKIEVVDMRDEPVNRWRLAFFVFKEAEMEVGGKRENLSYKQEEIEGIQEAGRRLSEIVRYFTAGNLAMDVSFALVEKEKITQDIIEDSKSYGYRVNMYKALPLLRKLSEEHFGRPLSYFDDVVVCSPLAKAGAAWGGWEFQEDGTIVRGLYIPNYWKDATKIWGAMVEVLLHEWIHCLEGHIIKSGLPPIPSADGGAMEGEILSKIKDETFRRPKRVKTWMPYYLHILRDFLSSDDWAKVKTSYMRELEK
ncbi:hypothetical protein H5T88_09035 [bacterium]|nr:hypothetical protein [bacterium]